MRKTRVTQMAVRHPLHELDLGDELGPYPPGNLFAQNNLGPLLPTLIAILVIVVVITPRNHVK
jgi:hypothetical protein